MDTRALIGQEVRLTLSDGRVVQGTLTCVDSDMNVVLDSAFEVGAGNAEGRATRESSHATPLALGQVMVEGKRLVHIKVRE